MSAGVQGEEPGARGPLLGSGVSIADGVSFGSHVVVHDGTVIGEGCTIEDHAVLGKRPRLARHSRAVGDVGPLHLAAGVSIGTGTVVFAGASIAAGAIVGDQAFVRERASIGERSVIGRGSAVDNDVSVGAGPMDVPVTTSVRGFVVVLSGLVTVTLMVPAVATLDASTVP